MRYDYIIVGQGIAGTVLSYLLMKEGKKIAIFDEFDPNASSRVAVGLFNPFTGRKMVKTWNADNLFPFFHKFYSELELVFGASFFQSHGMFRPFKNKEEQNDWVGRTATPGYAEFIKNIYTKPVYTEDVINPYGGIELNMAGYLVVESVLNSAREYFEKNAALISKKFEYENIEYSEEKIVYKGIEAQKIIFCEGYTASKNGFFKWLPFRPVKGEVLYLGSSMDIKRVYNRGCFITPKVNGLHRCGSTYNWKDLTTQTTDEGRKNILAKLEELINWEYEVVGQKAGIRPASKDRRPLIGMHPERQNFIIFNGLGTKGVSLAPYYANQLVKCLEEGKILDEEVNIERYYSLYYHTLKT